MGKQNRFLKNSLQQLRMPTAAALIFNWLSWVVTAEGQHLSVYLLAGIIGLGALYRNWKLNIRAGYRERIAAAVAGCFLSCASVFANYSILPMDVTDDFNILLSLIEIILLLLGGFVTFASIFNCAITIYASFRWREREHRMPSSAVFIICLLLFAVVYGGVLMACYFPGVVTSDSLSQIKQIMDGSYSNHHPFYHTMLIKLVFDTGMTIFGNINMAVALYSFFQIIVMGAIFSFTIMTIYQKKASNMFLALILAWYLINPVHIMYSFTMWKDVLFGGMVLLFVVALYRYFDHTGSHRITDGVLMFVGGLGMCLFRSNGWYAYTLVLIAAVVLFWKRNRRELIVLACIFVCAWILRGPVLAALNVSQPDLIESLSIPAQQIARVLADGNLLTENQEELLEQVVDVDSLAETYEWYCSDAVKNLVRATGNQQYLADHKLAYLRLWAEIGVQHPLSYIKAWIDSTKGYWNGGYKYWKWLNNVYDNSYGIFQTHEGDTLWKLANRYCSLWSDDKEMFCLSLFCSIGLMSWITFGLCVISWIAGRKFLSFLCFIPVSIILTLLIATPVYSETRYAYALFTCIPFLLFSSYSNFRPDSQVERDLESMTIGKKEE